MNTIELAGKTALGVMAIIYIVEVLHKDNDRSFKIIIVAVLIYIVMTK